MPLFERSDIRNFEQEEAPLSPTVPLPSTGIDGKATFLVGRHGVDLERIVPSGTDHPHRFVPSRGSFSLHEVIAFLAHRLGPCEAWLTTYGVSADPLQQVFTLCRQGHIVRFHLLTDPRVKTEAPEAYQLMLAAPDTCKVRFQKNHSKLLVMRGEHARTWVMTSANLTNNPRLEAYMFSTDPVLCDSTAALIGSLMTGDSPFDAQ